MVCRGLIAIQLLNDIARSQFRMYDFGPIQVAEVDAANEPVRYLRFNAALSHFVFARKTSLSGAGSRRWRARERQP